VPPVEVVVVEDAVEVEVEGIGGKKKERGTSLLLANLVVLV
jgi:hypothetical protein